MKNYAQINNDNICIGISQLSGEITAANMIEVETFDMSFLGKRYTDGAWQEVAPEPTPAPPPTDTELIMQALSDTELRDFEAQGERELLAQQMTDMELLLMEGGGMV